MLGTRTNEEIQWLNEETKGIANTMYADVYPLLLDEEGILDLQWSNDGLHVNATASELITKKLFVYLN